MDKKGTLQSRLRKIRAEIDEIKNEEKKELSKIEEKTRRVNSYRTLNSLDRESEKIQLEYKTKLRKKSEEMEDLQIEIHRLEDEG